MTVNVKRDLNQAHLETALYETMVQHLEREMELIGLATSDTISLTGIKNIGQAPNTNQERTRKITGPCFGCGHPGHLLCYCRKTNRDKRLQKTDNSTITTPCETKMSHETKDCYSGDNCANRKT